MTFADRCAAAFLGLAAGDAYGRPLEFIKGRRVRETTVRMEPGVAMWTDDTHMAWYLAQALLQQGPDALDPDAFGLAVGERFSAWLHDPLTPSTAPGNTCMAGVRAWEGCRDWRRSGVSRSDGCGAVMRIAPLAMALAGEDLTQAAEVQAALTHGHPNAREAAIAGAHLLRWTLERGRLDREMVEDAIVQLGGAWARGGTVARSLADALSHQPLEGEWLDEDGVHPGDGGWRSGSALGLAVAACLRWGERLPVAVDRAARIDGDSDSVACLVGMFLGAAGGIEALPQDWRRAIPWAGRLERIARELAELGEPLVVLADLHGHPELLADAVSHFDAGLPEHRMIPLGDYCDNGPDVAGLLELMSLLCAERPERFTPILGNHDVACLRALEDERWFAHWGLYWNAGGSTPTQLGARSGRELRLRLDPEHRALLESLPWVLETGRYVLVHAGMQRGALGPQLQELRAQVLPKERLFLPPPLRDKNLAKVGDPGWEKVVVSAHNKSHRLGGAVFQGPKRICLGADVDAGGPLRAMVLPERRVVEFHQGR